MRALGVDPDRPCALFGGRITRQRGVPAAVEAGPLARITELLNDPARAAAA